MIVSSTRKVSDLFRHKGIIAEEEMEIFTYGFELLLNTVFILKEDKTPTSTGGE